MIIILIVGERGCGKLMSIATLSAGSALRRKQLKQS
jgi:hypothetical protein